MVPAQDTTFYEKLSRQLPPLLTNCCCPVLQIPSFRLTLLGVLAVILTLHHLNQFFDEWTEYEHKHKKYSEIKTGTSF